MKGFKEKSIEELKKLSPKQQVKYEKRRAEYNIYKRNKKEGNKQKSWKFIFHILASEYGWTAHYILGLTVKQINFFLDGRNQYNKVVNDLQKKSLKKSGKTDKPEIEDIDGMVNSGAFKVKK